MDRALNNPAEPPTADGCPQCHRGGCVPLHDLRPGQQGTVQSSRLDEDDSAMLRAMGLRASAKVMLCSKGRPCIVSVLGAHGMCCRIGLAADLAKRVMVQIDG